MAKAVATKSTATTGSRTGAKTGQTQSNKTAKAAGSAPKKNATSGAGTTMASATGTMDEHTPLGKFFTDALKDMYWAEKALTEALPKMQQAATTDELKEAFEDHTLQTRKHVSRLEKVFRLLDQPAEARKCEAMQGLIKEGETIIEETPEGSMTRDAALIIAAQKVEHYEIATYGGLVQLALTLGESEAADILEQTLEEEEDTDLLLTEIAEQHINFEAQEETEEDIEDLEE